MISRSVMLVAGGMALAACQTSGSGPAAQSAYAPTEGAEVPVLVTAICGDCHAVTPAAISPNPQAPGFYDIANSPGVTHDTLVVFLSDAHNYPMQMDVDLDETDIETIADYLVTLQDEDYVQRPD